MILSKKNYKMEEGMLMNNPVSILVLGGGAGGVITANLLRKGLPTNRAKITLIDREANHVFLPSLLWLITGNRKEQQISRSLKTLEKKGIDVIKGEIEKIDYETRTVHVDGKSISADYIIISLGADLSTEEIPGLDSGLSFYDLANAQLLESKLRDFKKGHLVVLTASPVYKCPAAPYEVAMLINSHFNKNGLGSDVKISFYAAEPMPMGTAGKDISQGLLNMLSEKNIAYYPQHQISHVDPSTKTLSFDNGEEVSYDFLVQVPPHKLPKVLQNAPIIGSSGWVNVNSDTLETNIPGIYALGDAVGIPLPSGKMLPKAGVFAHDQAKVIANNLINKLTGKGQPIQFNGHGGCFVEIGDGKAGFAKGDFFASPLPVIKAYKPAIHWHLGKLLFEKMWFRMWF